MSPHAKPFVCETATTRALHFDIAETQSCMLIGDPDALALEYTRTMMGFLLFNPEPRQITMIGLGGGSLAKFCYRYLPDASISVIEINPHVISLRDAFAIPPDDERFRVIQADGARFVRDTPDSCDVLLVDGFDPRGLPARLSSPSFYERCRQMLRTRGILVANLHQGQRRMEALMKRLRRSFDGSLLVVDDDELENRIVFAGRDRDLARLAPEAIQRLLPIDGTGSSQLVPAFARIAVTLSESRGAGAPRGSGAEGLEPPRLPDSPA